MSDHFTIQSISQSNFFVMRSLIIRLGHKTRWSNDLMILTLFVLRLIINPLLSKHLLVQIQQQKHYKKVWNMFRGNSKEINTTSMTSSGVFIINFKHISHLFLVFLLLLWAGTCLLNYVHTFSFNLIYQIHRKSYT